MPGLGSRFDLVFDLVFPGLDFLVLSPFLPFFGYSLISLVGVLGFLLFSSLGRCCWWMFAAVGFSLFLSLFLVSAFVVLLGGKGMKKIITLLRVIPTMTFICFVTDKSSGVFLSDISFDIRSGILSDIFSGILPGKHSGTLFGIPCGILFGISSGIPSDILSGILFGKSSDILSGKHSDTLSGIPCGILSGISELILYIWHIFWHFICHIFWHSI